MTPEQQNAAAAQWLNSRIAPHSVEVVRSTLVRARVGKTGTVMRVPGALFSASRDTCALFEKELTPEEHGAYIMQRLQMVGNLGEAASIMPGGQEKPWVSPWVAGKADRHTPTQRLEAFLRSQGLWVDEAVGLLLEDEQGEQAVGGYQEYLATTSQDAAPVETEQEVAG